MDDDYLDSLLGDDVSSAFTVRESTMSKAATSATGHML
jgi:hypothetical protein